MTSTQHSEALFERAKRVTPGGVHSPVRAFKSVGGIPRFITEAKGACLTDADGNQLVDYCMSWGPLIFGHQDEDVAGAIHDAMDKGWTFGTASHYPLELAEYITERIKHVEKIRFVNSGTEAVMSAIRVARGTTERNKIVKFAGCYHGHVDSLLIQAGSGVAEMAKPDSAGVTEGTAADTIVCPLNDEAALNQIFEIHGREIAAVIMEPLPANFGLLIQRDEYLQFVREITQRYGSLLIFDEVMSGFRIGFGGMAERTGIAPDLVTYGKVIGGGFPVGAFGGRADLMDAVAPVGPVYQAGTLSGNPVAMRAGFATLKKLYEQSPYEQLDSITSKLANDLQQVAKSKGFALSVQHVGSKFWLIPDEVQTEDGMVRDVKSLPAEAMKRFAHIFHGLLNRGYYLAPSGFEVGFMATVHTEEVNAGLVDAFEQVLEEMTEERKAS